MFHVPRISLAVFSCSVVNINSVSDPSLPLLYIEKRKIRKQQNVSSCNKSH